MYQKYFQSNKFIFFILFCFFLAYYLLYIILTLSVNDDPNKIALGNQNQEVFAKFNNLPIHCQDDQNLELCIKSLNLMNLNQNYLWLGNSQLHAINQKKIGDINAPEILFKLLHNDEIFLLTLSQPNANLQEHYVLFEYISSNIKIDKLILPIVFDDMRETNIRNSLKIFLKSDYVLNNLSKTKIGKKILDKNELDLNINTIGLENSPQEFLENFLERHISNISYVWKNRDKLRSKTIQILRLVRNYIFNIEPTSVRRVIPQRYSDNFQSLEEIIKSAKFLNIELLVYIPPLRNDEKIPYDPLEYQKFKSSVKELLIKNDIRIHDFDNLIPSDYWGFKNFGKKQDLDFMHFQGEGHNILANAIYELLK